MITIKEITSLFEQGNFRTIVGEYFDVPEVKLDNDSLSYVVASLFFCDRYIEGNELFQMIGLDLKEKEKALVLFSRCLHLLRVQKSSKAQKDLNSLCMLAAEAGDYSRYFYCQALAVNSYFKGQYSTSLEQTEKAFALATKIFFLYGKVISLDLQGHCLIQKSRIMEGLSSFRQGIELSACLGNDGLTQSMEGSRLVYQSQFAIDIEETSVELEDALHKRDYQNKHRLPGLQLEKAKLLILKGQIAEAERFLQQIAQEILGAKISRNKILLHLRWAFLYELTGRHKLGVPHLEQAKSFLEPQKDPAIEFQLLGLVKRYQESGQVDDDFLVVRTETIYRVAISTRKLNRELRKRTLAFTAMIPSVVCWIDGVQKVLGIGFISKNQDTLGFLYRSKKMKAHHDSIYLDKTKRHLLLVKDYSLHFYERSLTSSMIRLLEILSRGRVDKETLVKGVWGYEYSPKRHDPSVYTLISRLRNALEVGNDFIESHEAFYESQVPIYIVDMENSSLESKKKTPIATEYNHFNPRQQSLCSLLEDLKSITVFRYGELFGISEASARRDLRSMVDSGYLCRQKKGKSTYYTRNQYQTIN